MKYLIDTAEKTDIEKWKKYVDGVTCNPLLLKKSNIDMNQYCVNNISLFDNIFVQINSLDDVFNLKMFSKEKIIFKVPLLMNNTYNGYYILKQLLQFGYRTCATIVYDISQFDFACKEGSEFSIVLYAKNSDHDIVKKCCKLKELKKYKTKIVAASFRNVEQICDCIKFGVDYSTIPPTILEKLFKNKCAIDDYYKFYEDT